MKKFLVIALVLATLPLFGQGTSVNLNATVDVNYFMKSVNDTETDGTDLTDEEVNQSYFGEVNSAIRASMVLPGDITGFIQLGIAESKSNGVDYSTALIVDEVWAAKKGAFGQDALGFKFGKHDVPFNLNLDNGITHAFTYGTALYSSGIGAINDTWGFGVSYAVEGVGTFTLTTFEGLGSYSVADEADEDTGLFNSMALQWDTGKDAFGVTGLRIVAGYEMRASYEDMDNGSCITAGATYEVMPGLVVGLEVDSSAFMTEAIDPGTGDYTSLDAKGGMLIALNADYVINPEFKVGLSYEMLSYSKNDDLGLKASTDSRMALRGAYVLAEDSEIRFEYSALSNSLADLTEMDWDPPAGDGDEDDMGYSVIAIGYKGKI